MFGICNLSVVPCRAEASDRSEMVTQLLFGEHFEVLEMLGKWVKIKHSFDAYECWIDKKQFQAISQETFAELQHSIRHLSTDLIQVVSSKENETIFPIVIGSSLPYFDGELCNLEGNEYSFEGSTILPTQVGDKVKILEFAYSYLNAPYLWGGRSPFGIDCSGFTQMVYKLAGEKLPRDAYQQAEIGTTLSFVEEAEPGDLAFFDNEEGKIIHVGIILEQGKIIHASGKVKLDALDHYGIFNLETKSYSHNLRLLKRII
jgi:gamma-D-glutamyl-L-lysine dipeptidyl-peptidase